MYDWKYVINDLISLAAVVTVILSLYLGITLLGVPGAIWIAWKTVNFTKDYENLQKQSRGG